MVAPLAPSRDEIWAMLDEVKDPEIPVLSVVELGIVRDVRVDGSAVVVDITPTYSGCPAMHEIERCVTGALAARGLSARVQTIFSPAWTTDWMSEEAREKLRRYGIAPPGKAEESPLVPLMRRAASPACPFCGSRDTVTRSDFGSTACKSLHSCNACHQPFEHFKAI
ncbi:MAG: phenylacetate-CoA oxygenase subunit PaaJ [Gemmatimonadetes bacterium]|nr:phenylacetate-CoA oxygenase subunit PaaJ [Gemmatimonadota bacterium]MBK6455450.1 phenylacetate-CoA oxygenase subunit PaaJ [Gemmatimonadota bacterium]MBK7835325.1 phenylacetate-CoA oxygenase subunit PaaJ [Gemmatimonadota bacterium]MBK8061717.1 phenylacetate-CoA oxygenase subunit PaaJ [Gemmatimonadota bacterium]MBK9406667.1 phenylacetate-CoA oxygenase subunit PaaJ [Gemmatimonadota bacterium]